MADYTPVTSKGGTYTALTSGIVAGGNLLVVSGSGVVAKAGADANLAVIGVAAHDAASGARVTVWTRGPVHESLAAGTVTAGDQISTTSTASRDVESLPVAAADLGATYVQAAANTAVNAAINSARGALGVALTTAGDNVKVRWMAY